MRRDEKEKQTEEKKRNKIITFKLRFHPNVKLIFGELSKWHK